MHTVNKWLGGGQQDLFTRNIQEMPWDVVVEVLSNQKEVRLWNKLAAMIDFAFPLKDVLKAEDLDTKPNKQLRNELQYCVTYAVYIYYMHFLGNPRGVKIVKREDFDNEYVANKPAYFISIDDKTKRILLCIRGTTTIGDVLSDLQGHCVEKSFGFDQIYRVHEGMYHATMSIYRDVTSKIAELANNDRYKDYQILITGHSLGAGICSILGLLWNVRRRVDPKRFRCYSFASPLVVDQRGRNKSLSFDNMVTVANCTDIVTRVSVNGLLAMNLRIEALREDPERNERLIASIIKKKTAVQEIEFDEEEKELIQRLKDVEMHSHIDATKSLYPCGKIYWFVPWYIADGDSAHERYQRLSKAVDAWCDIGAFQKWTKFFREILHDLFVDPPVSDDKLTLLQMRAEAVHEDDEEEPHRMDIFPFNELVCYGSESWEQHAKGRYSRLFGKNIVDIFEESYVYNGLKKLGFVRKLVDLWIVIHLSTLFILAALPLPSAIKLQIIYLYVSLVQKVLELLWSIWKRIISSDVDEFDDLHLKKAKTH